MEKRILNLRDDQIMALFYLVKIEFAKKDFKEILTEIRTNREDSQHLGILLDEADSAENLLWWICLFEKANKRTEL
jgi:hypothetical protein